MINNFKTLLGLVILLAGLAYYIVTKPQNDGVVLGEDAFLLPQLQGAEWASKLTDVLVTQGDEALHVNKVDSDWYVKGGFYTDMDAMKTLFSALQSAKKLEAKTKNPENFTQLQLNASGLRVTLKNGEQVVADVYLGKKGSSAGTAFARLADEDQSWLVSGTDQVTFMSDDWTLKTVIDHDASEVTQVRLDNGSDDVIELQLGAESGLLEFVSLPEGQQLKEGVHASQFASALSRFTIEEALPVDLTEKTLAVTGHYQLLDGSEITVQLHQSQSGEGAAEVTSYWATIDSAKYTAWMFKVPQYKFDAMNKSLSEFIEKRNESNDMQAETNAQ